MSDRTCVLRSTGNTPPPPALFDADASATSELVRHRRDRSTVGDAIAGYRADMVSQFLAARGDWDRRMVLLAEAAEFDKQHPDDVPLYDELHGTMLGLAA